MASYSWSYVTQVSSSPEIPNWLEKKMYYTLDMQLSLDHGVCANTLA